MILNQLLNPYYEKIYVNVKKSYEIEMSLGTILNKANLLILQHQAEEQQIESIKAWFHTNTVG